MDEGDEDYVFYGTPIECEEETSTRKRKSIADAGQLRALPTWKQEVRDEEGRRRFHGAFTGGYSAGYYNTVGSKQGWTPQTFVSSRKSRAEVKGQDIFNFLDDEDIKDMGGHSLETSSQFDTFGFTAAEVARKQAEREQQKRPSAIPGPAPDEIILPATNSIGVKLLVKMGWRRGHAIMDTKKDSLYDARREARKAFIAFSGNERILDPSQFETDMTESEDLSEKFDESTFSQSTPVYVLCPKQDLHGLGFDPFKHAPEFRDRKQLHDSRGRDQGAKTNILAGSKLSASNSGKYAPGFGIGALEELDVEDEDIYASGFDFVSTEVEEDEPSRLTIDKKLKLEYRKEGILSGFKPASNSEYNLERFHPPVIPADFEPVHKFSSPPDSLDKFADSPPPEVPPPQDNSLRLLIEGFATLVARCGKLFEDLSKEKNRSNPLFSFLSGGNGHDYYARKLWEAKKKSTDQQRQVDAKSISSDRKITAEGRGRILGEKPLGRSSNNSVVAASHKEPILLQSNLSDTFTKPTAVVDFSERAKPFKDDPEKQRRFEQFLKDKYQGGLRSIYSGATAAMSDNDRARERLDFEAAAEGIEKGEWNTKNNLPSKQQVRDLLGGDGRFVSSTVVEERQSSQVEEKPVEKIYPKREGFDWRPSPILCKRFELIDPFMGKPPPMPRMRSKMDSLIFMPDSVPYAKSADVGNAKGDAFRTPQSEVQEIEEPSKDEPAIEPDSTNVQRPVDLYKAIFSDDSEDEVDNASSSYVDDPEKKIEGVNTTLNRLVAGDFLETLGKELGLEVPPVRPRPVNKAVNLTSLAENGSKADDNWNGKFIYSHETSSIRLEGDKSRPSSASGKEAAHPDEGLPHSKEKDPSITTLKRGTDGLLLDSIENDVKSQKENQSRKHRSRSRHHRHSSSSDTDSVSDFYNRSKARSEKRTSSKGKSREHSGHHRHKRSRSPDRYSSRGKGRDLSDDSGKERRSRDKGRHARRKYH